MDVLQLTVGSIFLALGTAFLISCTLYRIAIFERLDNQSFCRDNGIFLFAFFSIWYLALGLYCFYNNEMVKYLQSQEYVLLFLALFCGAFAGIYFFKYHFKFPISYYLFQIFFFSLVVAITLLKTHFLRDFNIQSLSFLSIIGGLFGIERIWGNINNKISEETYPRLFPYWNTIKVYILRIEE